MGGIGACVTQTLRKCPHTRRPYHANIRNQPLIMKTQLWALRCDHFSFPFHLLTPGGKGTIYVGFLWDVLQCTFLWNCFNFLTWGKWEIHLVKQKLTSPETITKESSIPLEFTSRVSLCSSQGCAGK